MNHGAVRVTRGNYLESTHEAHVAVVDIEGNLLYSYGDPERLTFPRSSMKPFQAVPLIETDAAAHFQFTQKDIAISCASHSGEPFHREQVLSILNRIDLNENALQCGTHIPKDIESYKKLIREGGELTPVYSNCSGKHSGMLTTVVHMNEPVTTYREVNHPVQQRILNAIASLCNYPKEAIELGVDGCGVPVHRLPLKKTAYGYACLAKADVNSEHDRALKVIRNAMIAYPEFVGGTRRFDTDLMKAFKGRVVAKEGAEGVQCVGIIDLGVGIAVKIEDGNGRATSAVTMEVLRQIGVGNNTIYELLKHHVTPPVQNMRQDEIGKISAHFDLKSYL